MVASEVKELASQTARATDEIAAKISEIQQSTQGTVSSMAEIMRVIASMKQISSSIAGAVEEQGAATGEIAQNCQRAADGTQKVTQNITGVARQRNSPARPRPSFWPCPRVVRPGLGSETRG